MDVQGQIPLHRDGGLPLMGPVFYLVQSKEALRLISAMLLGNWPHEFALALLLGKGRAVAAPCGRRRFWPVSLRLRREKGSVLRSGAALERPQ